MCVCVCARVCVCQALSDPRVVVHYEGADFVAVTERAVFSLCPRGHGRASFKQTRQRLLRC